LKPAANLAPLSLHLLPVGMSTFITIASKQKEIKKRTNIDGERMFSIAGSGCVQHIAAATDTMAKGRRR
jgi:hypothetical protein